MFTHFSCSCSEGPVDVETDQAKLTETSKQRTAGKSSEQVIEAILFFMLISYLYMDCGVSLKLSVCKIHCKCVFKLLSVFYHLQLFADAQEEYDKHQKGKTLLNLVVIGKLVFTTVINHI